ncbi:MAG TPA: DUF5666 domain-containing protein [Ktedonobacterales bacterium]|jgi:hypothetical protein
MSWKLKRLLSNKIAVAIFGAILVASAGSAAALAASGGRLQTPFASQTPSSAHHHSDDGSHDDHGNLQNANHDDGHEAEGTITSIDAAESRFVVKTEHNASVTVVVNTATVFTDGLHSFGDLKTGMSVEVDGNVQPNGTLIATKVHGDSDGPDDDKSDDHGGDNDSGASATPGADDHGSSSGSGSSTPGSGGHDDGAPHD